MWYRSKANPALGPCTCVRCLRRIAGTEDCYYDNDGQFMCLKCTREWNNDGISRREWKEEQAADPLD